jgi:hypothetical protein
MANGFAKEARHHFSKRCVAILHAGLRWRKAGAIHALT